MVFLPFDCVWGRWFGVADLFCFCIEVFNATDEGVFFDDGKIFKKVSILACNFGNMVYSMCSYRSTPQWGVQVEAIDHKAREAMR